MISIRYLLAILCLISVSPASAQYFDTLYGHPAHSGILDGAQKTFLVTGYSTSHRPNRRPWPTIFQEMLDAHAGASGTYFVVSHTVSGTPIAKWMGTCGPGGHVKNALDNYVDPGKRLDSGVPEATIMLAQQSLQWAFGNCQDRFITIEGPGDQAEIEMGATAIHDYVNAFLDGGIEQVYMATHIYKDGYPLGLCGESFAMTQALSSTDNFYPGPELCDITATLFPAGYDNDMVHPGPQVASAMALYWYLVIAGEQAKPEVYEPIALEAGISVPVKTSIGEVERPGRSSAVLHAGFPNPFQSQTTIAYSLPSSGPVEISVYNQLGQQLNVLVDAQMPAGDHRIVWDGYDRNGRSLPAGVYFIRMTTRAASQTSQVVLIR